MIPPYKYNTPESHIKFIRIKEMITNERSSQLFKKWIKVARSSYFVIWYLLHWELYNFWKFAFQVYQFVLAFVMSGMKPVRKIRFVLKMFLWTITSPNMKRITVLSTAAVSRTRPCMEMVRTFVRRCGESHTNTPCQTLTTPTV